MDRRTCMAASRPSRPPKHDRLTIVALFGLALVTLAIVGKAGFVVAAAVQQPVMIKQLKWTGTSWFGSPIIHDLGTDENKLVGTFYDIFVWDKDFNQIAKAPSGG